MPRKDPETVKTRRVTIRLTERHYRELKKRGRPIRGRWKAVAPGTIAGGYVEAELEKEFEAI